MSTSPWELRPVDAEQVSALALAHRLQPVTARCLIARGVAGSDVVDAFLEPRLGGLRPPEGLAGLEVAVSCLAHAVTRGTVIGVFGDYDADGVTSAALLTSFLRACGAVVHPRVASRAAGYGFGLSDVAWFADAGCSLLVTCDCGTSDVEAIGNASSRGIDVVVIDHHTVPVQREDAPPHPALALINPHRADSTFPFCGMASVGLAFYVAAALRTELQRSGTFNAERPAPEIKQLLDLVAIGTVADMVPLVGENRILTTYGLRALQRRQRPGIAALADRAALNGSGPITAHDIGWRLGPRLNAPGRIGEAAPSLALMLAPDRPSADELADVLEQANDTRRELQQQVYEQARATLGAADPGAAVVVAGEGWAHGVVGIVAAKLVQEYGRPAFVIAVDSDSGEGRGSARTCGGIDLYAALEACSEVLTRFGGHRAAAGLTVESSQIAVLRERLCAEVEHQRSLGEKAPVCVPVDAEVTLAQVVESLVLELQRMAPFGVGNEAPLLLCRGLQVRDSRRVGHDGAHLKFEVSDDAGVVRSAIAFGLGAEDPGPGARIDVAFEPSVNEWRGRRTVELSVRRIVPCSP